MSMEQERGIENSIIECTGVCKSFETPEGEHQVIKDFNLQAKENEFLVLFGPGRRLQSLTLQGAWYFSPQPCSRG